MLHRTLHHSPRLSVVVPAIESQRKIFRNTVLTEHTDDLKRGEFLVVTPGQIRVAGRYT
jgi:hypothetical protein